MGSWHGVFLLGGPFCGEGLQIGSWSQHCDAMRCVLGSDANLVPVSVGVAMPAPGLASAEPP